MNSIGYRTTQAPLNGSALAMAESNPGISEECVRVIASHHSDKLLGSARLLTLAHYQPVYAGLSV